MKRVRIKGLPQAKKGGSKYPDIYFQAAPWALHNTAGDPPTEARKSIQRDDENPNLEAEGGETELTTVGGLPAHFNINGPSHAEGGVPMRATEDSFIFSKFLKMPKDLAEYFGYSVKKGKSQTSKYSYADAAKKYGGVVNDARQIMADPNATKMDVATAELNIKNSIDKLGQIALAQESSKGLKEIPSLAIPYLMRVGADPAALMPLADNEEAEQQPGNEMAEGEEMPEARYGGLPIAQTGKMRRIQRRINKLKGAQVQPRVIVDPYTGITYTVDGYGNIINTPFGGQGNFMNPILERNRTTPVTTQELSDAWTRMTNAQSTQQQPTSTTTTIKYQPPKGAIVINRNEGESDEAFQARLKEEFKKAPNKNLVYTVTPSGGYQKVTAKKIAKALPSSYAEDPRLGRLNGNYAYVESLLSDPKNDDVVTKMYENYKAEINSSSKISSSEKAKLLKLDKKQVLDLFMKAQKQVFAIHEGEQSGKVDTPITKDVNDIWDKSGNAEYKKTMKALGFSDDEIFDTDNIVAFQAAYRGLQKASIDDSAIAEKLKEFDLIPRGMRDKGDYDPLNDPMGRQMSGVDKVWGNTTAGQGLFAKGNLEDEILDLTDIKDQTKTEYPLEDIPESPEYTPPHELQYLGPDVNNMVANLAIMANQPNVMPMPGVTPSVPIQGAYLDPSREIAETQGLASTITRGSGVYGTPQAYAAATGDIQGKASEAIANTLSKFYNANNEIYDNLGKLRYDRDFKVGLLGAENAKTYYDELTQKIQNQKDIQNQAIAQTAQLKNAMDVNAAELYNLEEMNQNRYLIDKPSGVVYFNKPRKLTGQVDPQQFEQDLERIQELMRTGVSADQAARSVMGTKGAPESEDASGVAAINKILQQQAMAAQLNPNMMQAYMQAGTGAMPYPYGT